MFFLKDPAAEKAKREEYERAAQKAAETGSPWPDMPRPSLAEEAVAESLIHSDAQGMAALNGREYLGLRSRFYPRGPEEHERAEDEASGYQGLGCQDHGLPDPVQQTPFKLGSR